MTAAPRNTILMGDVRQRLSELPAASLDAVITSPPYYGLRDYGATGQLGTEPDVHAWVANLRGVAREIARVLSPSGSFWLNLGDSFSRHTRYGTPPKGLVLAPERLLLALAQDGWLVRNKVIWHKTNPMPSSVTDRLTLTYEVVYHLVRSKIYFYDLDAIREPHTSSPTKRSRPPRNIPGGWAGPLAAPREGLRRAQSEGRAGHVLGRNPGDVWRIATRGTSEAHFAVFPEELVRRPILATVPEKVCTRCGQPWQRRKLRAGDVPPEYAGLVTLPELVPCGCRAPTRPGLVLDPFLGSGTTAVVAARYGRDWLGIELNPAYVAMAYARLGLAPPEVAA